MIDAQKNNQGILIAEAEFSHILEMTIFSSLKTRFLATLCLLIFSVYSNSDKQSLCQYMQNILDIFSDLIETKTLPSVHTVVNYATYLDEL